VNEAQGDGKGFVDLRKMVWFYCVQRLDLNFFRSKVVFDRRLFLRCPMKKDALTNVLLSLIAIALIAIAIRPYIDPPLAEAQSSAHSFYIEPGVQMLRAPNGTSQVYGKMVVDLRTGKIWGFPTGSLNPYPSNPMDAKPVVSRPFELGKFAFEDTDK
jgi:hypothetical protein